MLMMTLVDAVATLVPLYPSSILTDFLKCRLTDADLEEIVQVPTLCKSPKACNLSFEDRQLMIATVLQLTECARSRGFVPLRCRRSKVRRCMRACTKPINTMAALECGKSAHGKNKER